MCKVGDLDSPSTILRVCMAYAADVSLNEIARNEGVHKQQIKRYIQKALKWFADNYEPDEEPQDEKM